MTKARMEGKEFVLCHHDLSEGAQVVAMLLQDGEVTIEDIAEFMGRAVEEATFETSNRAGITSDLLADYFEAISQRLRTTYTSGNSDKLGEQIRILQFKLSRRRKSQ